MPIKKLTQDDLNKILHLSRNGQKLGEIARVYDVSVQYIRKLVRDDDNRLAQAKRDKHLKDNETFSTECGITWDRLAKDPVTLKLIRAWIAETYRRPTLSHNGHKKNNQEYVDRRRAQFAAMSDEELMAGGRWKHTMFDAWSARHNTLPEPQNDKNSLES